MATNLKAQLFDLADQDREAIARIREALELNSNALVVRLAIRELARRLGEPKSKTRTQEDEQNA
jgi:hypothetical protein